MPLNKRLLRGSGGILILIVLLVGVLFYLKSIHPVGFKIKDGSIYRGYFGTFLHLTREGEFILEDQDILLYLDPHSIMVSSETNVTWNRYPLNKYDPLVYILESPSTTRCEIYTRVDITELTLTLECSFSLKHVSLAHVLFQLAKGEFNTTREFTQQKLYTKVKKLVQNIGYKSNIQISFTVHHHHQVYTYRVVMMDKFKGKTLVDKEIFLHRVITR